MFALVESGSITKFFSGNKGINLNNLKYPKSIFTLWTKSEREAIGIYEVIWDNTNKKDEKWYINTNVSYAFGSGKVTASYGSATAKAHADTLYTEQDAGTAVPSAITNHRAAVRTKAAEMETAITNAADTPALETLYTYVNTADEGDPVVMERPLGELPRLES
jgi:hypothetical protein